ncbi:hypothetical protein SAMN05519103_06261 [Rhizobiales bacterium GAS113]|nr:hypothetical protein SAMN05519103_06261 [Rhizobiales bacterium GAS113]
MKREANSVCAIVVTVLFAFAQLQHAQAGPRVMVDPLLA